MQHFLAARELTIGEKQIVAEWAGKRVAFCAFLKSDFDLTVFDMSRHSWGRERVSTKQYGANLLKVTKVTKIYR